MLIKNIKISHIVHINYYVYVFFLIFVDPNVSTMNHCLDLMIKKQNRKVLLSPQILFLEPVLGLNITFISRKMSNIQSWGNYEVLLSQSFG